MPLWLPFAPRSCSRCSFSSAACSAATAVPEPPRPRPAASRRGAVRLAGGDEPEDDDEPSGLAACAVEDPRDLHAASDREPARRPRRSWRRSRSRSTSGAGGPASTPRTQTRVERIALGQARRVAGHAVTVRCDTSGRTSGSSGMPTASPSSAARSLADARDLLPPLPARDHGDHGSFSATGRAIAVLAHEAWHLRGVRTRGSRTATRSNPASTSASGSGLSRSRPAANDAPAARRQRLDSSGDRRYLVPAGCKDGGHLDLHRSSKQFP